MKYLHIIFVSLIVHVGLFAQVKHDSVVQIDTSSVVVDRQINDSLANKYSGETFDYTTKTGESQNLMLRFLNWIGQGLEHVFGIELSPQLVQLLKYVIYAFLFIAAIYLVVKVLTNESFNSIFNKKAKNLSSVNLDEVHIETVDLYALLENALNEKAYRLAIRYHFLLTLQRLSKTEIIQWHFEKTNADYLKEIQETSLRNGFKKVTYIYDHIWYGEQPIAQDQYDKFVLDFDSINQLIAK